MLCHRCGTELAGAATCGNCGAPAARRRFRPTLTAVRPPDPEALRAAAAGLEKGEVVGEQFTLGDPIGTAAGGWLFEAREPGGGRLAVRFVGPIADAEARASALEILERARRLSHDNIARTYAAGAHRDWLFTAGERLDGLTLAKIIQLRHEKQQRFTLAELLPIFEPLRDALLHAHRHLPHGGLDPSVVHILPTALKVADFGLASALPGTFASWRRDAERARTLAPEVLAGQAPSARSDIFSLGALVHEMVTGSPFSVDAPPPSVVLGIVGGHPIDALVARATAADPEERHPDVVTFAEALSVLADGPPLDVDDGERTRKVAAPRSPDEISAARTGPFERAQPASVEADADAVTTAERPAAAPQDEVDTAPLAAPESSRPPPVPATADVPTAAAATAAAGTADASAPSAKAASTPPPTPTGSTSGASVPPPLPAALDGRSAPPPPTEQPSAEPARPEQPLPEQPPSQQRRPELPPPGNAGPAGRGAVITPGSAGPSVVIDPAFARLDTMPPPADFSPGSDRTPTQPLVVPPRRRPWIVRSNLGFGLLLLLIVGGVAAAAVWFIQREGTDGPDGPTVQTTARPEPVKPRQPPPVVVATIEADAQPPAAPAPPPPAAPTPVGETARARVEAPAPRRVAPEPPSEPEPVSPSAEPEPPVARDPEPAPPEPEPPEPAPPEPAPPEPAPPEPAPPEPDAAVAAPPPAEELRCPGGMVLVTHRGFPDDGKRGGAITGVGIAAARAGEAYCIDAYEYPGRGETPRTGVNFEAARGLCIARGRRLCTDAEWRRGCAGRRGGAWPYGAAFDPAKCNTEDADGEERAIAPAGKFRRCKSIRGLYDMSGNVAEWTADQTVRGGDFASTEDDASCGGGGKRAPGSSRPSIGFRCCTDFTE